MGTVVIVDAALRQTIYLIEALIRNGVTVKLLCIGDDLRPALLRSWVDVERVGSVKSEATAKRLRDLADDPDVDWIFPQGEAAIIGCREILGQNEKLFPQLSDETYQIVFSKPSSKAFAAAHGVLTPASICPQNLDAAIQFAEKIGYPAVVKADGENNGARVVICHDRTALIAAYEKLEEFHPFIEQFVEGDTWIVGGFFVDGEAVRLQCCKAIRTNPPRTGHAIEVEHKYPEPLVAAALEFYRGLRWTGFANCDFIGSSDGKFYFLESNPRAWGSVIAAEASGRDIFDAAADYFRRQAPSPRIDSLENRKRYVFPNCLYAAWESGGWPSVIFTVLQPRYWISRPKKYPRSNAHFLKDFLWTVDESRRC